jgi:hypothetical protein
MPPVPADHIAPHIHHEEQTMATATKTYSVGPGALATPGAPGGPPFAMSTSEWLAIQRYVIDALALPVTEAEFRKALGDGAPPDLSDFTQLVAAYKAINQHCAKWQNATFPMP